MGLSSWIMFPCRLTVLGMSFFWTNPNVSYNGFNIYAIKLYYVHYLTIGFITGYVRWWVVCTQDTGVLLVWIPATVWEGTSQLKLWCWIVVAATLDVDVFCFSDWLKGWTGRSLLLLHLGLSENGIPPDSHDYHYFFFFSHYSITIKVSKSQAFRENPALFVTSATCLWSCSARSSQA